MQLGAIRPCREQGEHNISEREARVWVCKSVKARSLKMAWHSDMLEFVYINTYLGNRDHSDTLCVGLGRRYGGNSGASRLSRTYVHIKMGVRVRG